MKRKILIVLAMILALALCLVACGNPETPEKKVTKLTLEEGSISLDYVVGDTPDFSNIKIKVEYSDGSTEILGRSSLELGSISTATAGKQNLSVKVVGYDFSTIIQITVNEAAPVLSSIKIVPGSVASQVVIFDDYDVSGLQVEATYSDGAVVPLAMADITVTKPDTTSSGTKKLTVSYGGKTDSVDVRIIAVKAMSVLADSISNVINVGATLNTDSLKVLVTFDDDSRVEIGKSELTVGSIETFPAGVKTLKITYKGFTLDYKITVRSLTAIKITSGSVDLSVKVNGNLDLSRMDVQAIYSDGTELPIALKDLKVNEIDTSAAGKQTLTVQYGGKTDSVEIDVVGVASLSVASGTLPTELLVGAVLDTSKLRVDVVYTDGSTGVLYASDLTVGNLTTTTAGTKSLSIQYLDKKDYTYSIKVCGVESIRVDGIVSSVIKGSTPSLNNMKVYAVYGDSKSTEVLLNSGYTTNISSLNFNSVGAKEITVNYNGPYGNFNTKVTVEVLAPKLTDLVVEKYDNLLVVDQDFQLSSLKVTAKYENNDTASVPFASLVVNGSISTAAAGQQSATLSYTEGDVTKSVAVSFKVLPVSSFTVNGMPKTVDINGNLDTEDVWLSVVYSDGESQKNATVYASANNKVSISALNTSASGDKTVTVEFYGKSVDCTVHVKGVKSMTVSGIPTEILVGGSFDSSVAKLRVEYTDGSFADVPASAFSVSSLDTTEAGNKTVTVSYPTFSASETLTVKVCGVQSLRLEGVPRSVKAGESLDLSGLKVYTVYEDSLKTEVLVTGYTTNASSLDFDVEGDKTLVVTYNGFTASAVIATTEPDLESIRVEGFDGVIACGTLTKADFLGKIKVYAVYANGTEELVANDKYSIENDASFDCFVAGTHTLTVKYVEVYEDGRASKEVTKSVSVKTLPVASFTVSGMPAKINKGESIDYSFVSLGVTYSDGTDTLTGTISAESDSVAIVDVDSSTGGDKTVKFTLFGVSVDQPIHVKAIASIEMVDGYNNEVLVGGSLDTTGYSATVTWTDGETMVVNAAKLTIGQIDSSSAGTKQLSVSYGDVTINVSIKVCGIESIRVDGIPSTIVEGETLIGNMKVWAIYGDKNSTEVLLTDGFTTNIDQLNLDVAGEKTLSVAYNGLSANVTVTVVRPALTGITVSGYESLVRIGGTFDTSSIKFVARYANNTTAEIALSAITLGGSFDTATAGAKSVSVSYTEGGITVSASISYKVLPVASFTAIGVPTVVNKGAALDTSAIKLSVTFSDGVDSLSDELTATDAGVVIGSIDTTSGGNKPLAITVFGVTQNYDVHVKAVTGILLSGTLPTMVRRGYAVDLSGLRIRILYSNNTEEIVDYRGNTSVFTYSCDTDTAAATAVVTIGYEGFTATVTVNVLQIKEVTALNGTIPASVILNSTFPRDKVKLTVVYVDAIGTEYVYNIGVDDPLLFVSDVDTSTSGDKAVVFKFMGYETSVRVVVNGISALTVVPGTLQTTLNVGQELVTSDVKLRVDYTDGTYIYVDTTSPYISIGSIDTSSEGNKILTISYQSEQISVNITVKRIVENNSMIFGTSLPNSITSRESYKNNFKDKSQAYVVGDDNPFIFRLVLLMLDDEDNLVDTAAGYVSTSKVYLLNGASETLVGSEYVTIDETKNSFDFTDAAVGKTFKIVSAPAAEPSMSQSFTFNVVDGYNVYTAKELNVMTNVDTDLNGGNMEGHLSQLAAVNNFLQQNGITRPANINGIVLHNNIDVKISDIPSEYLYTYKDKNGVEKKEFYDHLSVFNHKVDDANPVFNFYGNYYNVYSYNLPCITPAGIANNDDAFSSSELFRLDIDKSNLPYEFDHTKYTHNIINAAFRDNDPNSNDQSASERHMRGLIGIKIGLSVVNVNNSNLDAYYISIVVDSDDTSLNFNQAKLYNSWQGHVFVWSSNFINELWGAIDAEPHPNHQNTKINVVDSLLAKCGGPVILVQNANADKMYNSNNGADLVIDDKSTVYSYVTGQEAWFVAVGQTTMAGQILAMDQLVSGTAAAMGQSASYLSNQKIAGVDTMNLIMVSMPSDGPGAPGDCDSSFVKVNSNGTYEVGLNMNDGQNPALDQFMAGTGGVAPIFQSSAGSGTTYGTAYSDGATGLYVAPGAYATPDTGVYSGNYITLYYIGMGVMLEYYHN